MLMKTTTWSSTWRAELLLRAKKKKRQAQFSSSPEETDPLQQKKNPPRKKTKSVSEATTSVSNFYEVLDQHETDADPNTSCEEATEKNPLQLSGGSVPEVEMMEQTVDLTKESEEERVPPVVELDSDGDNIDVVAVQPPTTSSS